MLDQSELNHFIGSLDRWKLGVLGRWPIQDIPGYPVFPIATEGAMYVLENGGKQSSAFWLWDVISSHIMTKKAVQDAARFGILVIVLEVADSEAKFRTEDGNNKVLSRQEIPYTDFTDGEWKLFFQNNTLFLPSEY